ncbi:hypothetical protein LQF76_10100 [Gloeomargaritales cyanobacterium VI4D9]|nr:hypothetical protein LQF76_10100 [Gloeomargaritales cyanobacterium VI4D9]
MNVGKALLLVLSRWNLTQYRLSQLSGVNRAVIGKVVSGKQPSLMWDDIEKLADGLAKVDPLATAAFYEALKQPEQFFHTAGIPSQPEIMEREKSENIEAVITTLLKLGIVTPDRLEECTQSIPKNRNGSPSMSLAEWISVNMQWERLGTDEEPET